MFTPWLSDFNFRNWMDRTGIFNTKRIEKRWRKIRKSGKGTREGPLLPRVVILLSRRPGWESDRQPTCSHKIPALPFKGLCDPNSLLNSPFLHNWPISLLQNLALRDAFSILTFTCCWIRLFWLPRTPPIDQDPYFGVSSFLLGKFLWLLFLVLGQWQMINLHYEKLDGCTSDVNVPLES